MTEEKDPSGKNQHEPGAKLDYGKPELRFLKQFEKALSLVCLVSAYGANKYTESGWKYVPDGYNRYTSALLRHLLAPEDFDAESGLLHDAQVAWNALARLEIKVKEAEKEYGQNLPWTA